ncbi:selenocysteine lyase, partial [Xanthomonas sp. Kuri4-1]
MSAADPTEYDAVPLDWEHRGDAFALPRGVIYLDAAARGPLLCSMQAAAHRALEAAAAPWQLPFDAWNARIERVRALAAGLFDDDPDGVALVPSAAHGLA